MKKALKEQLKHGTLALKLLWNLNKMGTKIPLMVFAMISQDALTGDADQSLIKWLNKSQKKS